MLGVNAKARNTRLRNELHESEAPEVDHELVNNVEAGSSIQTLIYRLS